IGILVFSFYQYNTPPIFFNKLELNKIENSTYQPQVAELKAKHQEVFENKKADIDRLTDALAANDEQQIDAVRVRLQEADAEAKAIRADLVTLMKENDSKADTNDNNYIFLSFVTDSF